jgi:hypothetical protein
VKRLVLDSKGYGTVIQASLSFLDFDPSGGTAIFQVIDQPERAMLLDGPGLLASYTTIPNDFRRGRYIALVEVTKDGVRVPSERFQLEVL